MAAGAGKTPTSAARNVPAAADSTRRPQHKLPVNQAGPMTLTAHNRAPAVTGPVAWENGRDATETPGTPPLAGATPADVHPTGRDVTNC